MKIICRYLLLLLMSFFTATNLLAKEFEEGIHYQKIELKSSRHTKNEIEVALFYAYGDLGGFALEPHLNQWLKTIPETVYFIRRPSVKTEKDWALALSYIRAEMVGKGDKVHTALFTELNRTPPGLNSMKELVKFNSDQAINGNLPMHVLQANFKRLSSEWADNTIPEVSSIIVGQQYLVTKEMAGSNEAIITIIDALINKIRQKESE